MKTAIAIYSTDAAFRIQFVDSLAQHFPFRSIFSMNRLSRTLGSLPAGARPSLIFVDLSKPNLYSKIRLAMLNKSYPEAELVILVAEEKPVQIFEFIKAGASAYLLKEGWQSTLPPFLAHLEEQKVLISPKVARYLVDRFKCLELYTP